jgi:hypothetical protein
MEPSELPERFFCVPTEPLGEALCRAAADI